MRVQKKVEVHYEYNSIGEKTTWWKQSGCFFFLNLYNHLPFNNRKRIKGEKNHLDCSKSFLKKTRIAVKGNSNQIIFGERCTLRKCSIYISGSNNIIQFGDKVAMMAGEIHIEDDNNTVMIGSNTSFLGKTHLACIEGTNITIGKDCLFSSEVVLRTGDSHAITDLNGQRINPSKDITLDDHVWVGNRCILTKGATVAAHSVVATGAVLTSAVDEPHVIIGGVPAKVIKKDVSWDINRNITHK